MAEDIEERNGGHGGKRVCWRGSAARVGGCASLQLEFNFFVTKEWRKRPERGCTLRKEGMGWNGSGDS